MSKASVVQPDKRFTLPLKGEALSPKNLVEYPHVAFCKHISCDLRITLQLTWSYRSTAESGYR